MCCGNSKGPKWKKEIVKDHKFDYVDIEEFYDPSCLTRVNYALMYILILKGFLVYIADLWTAVSLLVIGNSSINADASIPPEVAKWIFLGAIMISFVILLWEIRKSRITIKTRDISLNFFNNISSRWYSIKDYRYFCLFSRINNSRKQIDSIAFFVFFTLKGWKKILLAEAPRQVINIVTLKTILPKWIQINQGITIQNNGLGKTSIQRLMTGTMIFSTAVFAVSFILLCAAAVIYIPVLCHIRGNLKEYCCHKVDKRIEELLRKQARKRIEKNNRNMMDKNHKKSSKKDEIEMGALPEPTLPQVDLNGPPPSNYLYPSAAKPYPYQQYQKVPNQPRPYYHQPPSSNAGSMTMGSPFTRRASLSSVNSDQVALTSHVQDQPRSSPYYNHMHNDSSSNLSYNNYPQQYQQTYQHVNNNYQPYPSQQGYY